MKLTTILVILGSMLYITTCKNEKYPSYKTLSDLYSKYYESDTWKIITVLTNSVIIEGTMYKLEVKSLNPFITFDLYNSSNVLIYTGMLNELNELYLVNSSSNKTIILTKSRLKCQSDYSSLLLHL